MARNPRPPTPPADLPMLREEIREPEDLIDLSREVMLALVQGQLKSTISKELRAHMEFCLACIAAGRPAEAGGNVVQINQLITLANEGESREAHLEQARRAGAIEVAAEPAQLEDQKVAVTLDLMDEAEAILSEMAAAE